jgi:hypothetical protein
MRRDATARQTMGIGSHVRMGKALLETNGPSVLAWWQSAKGLNMELAPHTAVDRSDQQHRTCPLPGLVSHINADTTIAPPAPNWTTTPIASPKRPSEFISNSHDHRRLTNRTSTWVAQQSNEYEQVQISGPTEVPSPSIRKETEIKTAENIKPKSMANHLGSLSVPRKARDGRELRYTLGHKRMEELQALKSATQIIRKAMVQSRKTRSEKER